MIPQLSHTEHFVRSEIIDRNLEVNVEKMALGTRGVLVREAKNRGWEVNEITREITYFQHHEIYKGALVDHTPHTISRVGWLIGRRKDLTKKVLELNGIPSPKGRHFTGDDKDEALSFFNSFDGSLVMKPSRGSVGRGISMILNSEAEFDKAWDLAVHEDGARPIILLEELVHGLDVRVVVVDGKVRAAATRVPPFVVGNGIASFGDLISTHRSIRQSNGYLRSHKLYLDHDWIAQNGWEDSTVLPAGEIAFLRLTSNASRGGFIVNVLPKLSPALVDLAERTAKSIPGVDVVGVDLMIDTFDSADKATILEINASPHLEIHHFPTFGDSTDLAYHVVNHMERTAI